MNPIEKLKRVWSKAPNKASREMPVYFGTSPRLDPVRYIAKQCAGIDLKLYKKSDFRKNGAAAEIIAEHEIYELLENPVPTFKEIDGFTLRYLTFVYLDLVGECGWLKIREGKKIIALLPIPKAWIISKPTINNHTYKILPYGEMGGIELTVADDDFILFKDVNPEDPYGNGKGLSEGIADEIEIDEYASKYQKNFFFNDATPPYVVTGFQGNQQSADQIKATLKERLSGYIKAREPAVLTGQMDIKPLGLAPKELDMVESRKFIRDECLQHYQLPPEVFGIIENSNRATIDASFYLTQKNVLAPRLQFFERVLNRQLLPEFDSDLICKHDLVVLEDEELNYKVYTFGVQNACITVEEFRKKYGLNPEIKEGTLLKPISAEPVPAGEIDLPDAEPEEEVELPETEENDDKKSYALKLAMQKNERDMWKQKVWKMFDEKALSTETYFIQQVKKIAKKQAEAEA